MSTEKYHPANRIEEINPNPKVLSMLEGIEGLNREDARFLILLDQKIGDDTFGNALFALRCVLLVMFDPQKFIKSIEVSKSYDRQLYKDFHQKRNALGKNGPVLKNEPQWGDFSHDILNLSAEEFEVYLSNNYKQEEEESKPEEILKKATNDFNSAIANLSGDERERLFILLGIKSVETDRIVFYNDFTQDSETAKNHSEYIKKIAASLSEAYKTAISYNPFLDSKTHNAIKESGQYQAFNDENRDLNFSDMPTESLVRGLIATHSTNEVRDAILNEFLRRCASKMSSSGYRLFERQVKDLALKRNWTGIAELAIAHLQE